MAKKDKKSKTADKKARIAEKTSRKAAQKEKKAATQKGSAKGAHDSDSDSDANLDLDAVLAEYAKKQAQFLSVTETVCAELPSPRSSSTFLASPANANELLLFGGEYYDGALARFYNDLYVYNVSRDEWRAVTSPNSPLPRSGHAWTRAGNQPGVVYLFGGEFSSPKQGTFYHYGDFWKLDAQKREWEKIETRSKGPPARSGHRMTYFKNYILLFGGFQDTSQTTKYLSDLWVYDCQNFAWHQPTLPPASQRPDPRSSFSFLPHESGAVLYGGYSRVKSSTTTRVSTKGGGTITQAVLKPLVHQDSWFLRVTPPPADVPSNTSPSVRWERRKRPTNAPSPPRAGTTMAFHRGRGIQFGGVHDVEESEEGIESEFFNQLFVWNIDRNRYFPLTLRRPKAGSSKKQNAAAGVERGSRRARGKADEEELLRNLAALENKGVISTEQPPDKDASSKEIRGDEENEEVEVKRQEKLVIWEMPHPRFNAQLAVQDDVLYIFGGTYEKGGREFTLDEMWAVDLGKLDGMREIYRREIEDWRGSDDDEDEDGDEEEDDDDEEEQEDDGEGLEVKEEVKDTALGGEEEAEEKARAAGRMKRKLEQQKRASISTDLHLDMISGQTKTDISVQHTSTQPTPTTQQPSDTWDDDDTATLVEEGSALSDALPHPRPFETLRAFYARTSNEWQELLVEEMRKESTDGGGEDRSVKELRKHAFDRAEKQWWDCREEIQALEDEQEDAGIVEVVSLADRSKAESGGAVLGGASRRR